MIDITVIECGYGATDFNTVTINEDVDVTHLQSQWTYEIDLP